MGSTSAAHDRRSRILRALLLLPLLGAGNAPGAIPPPPDPEPQLPSVDGQCVVLLHGLGRTSRSMARIEAALREAGYATANIDYPSQSRTIEASAAAAVPQGVRECRVAGAHTVHFVTHSMGGLLLRYYLSARQVAGLGRVVMLAPPNQGSEVADALVGTPLYDRINGPAGAQLVTGPDGIAERLGPVDFPLGVIAGNQQTALDSVLATRFPGENDGKVAVDRARVEGMADFLVLPVNHTFMVANDVVIGQTLQFLRYGGFLHEAPGPGSRHAAACRGARSGAATAQEENPAVRRGLPDPIGACPINPGA